MKTGPRMRDPVVEAALDLRQLEGDGDVSRRVDGVAVAGRRTEADLLSNALRFLVESVTESAQYALDGNLSIRQECNAQDDITLYFELARFRGVLHRGLRDELDVGVRRLCRNFLDDGNRLRGWNSSRGDFAIRGVRSS